MEKLYRKSLANRYCIAANTSYGCVLCVVCWMVGGIIENGDEGIQQRRLSRVLDSLHSINFSVTNVDQKYCILTSNNRIYYSSVKDSIFVVPARSQTMNTYLFSRPHSIVVACSIYRENDIDLGIFQ